ncbi:hypothetical protein QOZ80_2AG0131910 [Eleusine coracana subsp. coracana]|nr:hypothetical protein QOZ80_2AG0131910 [Eleusine coracana subsp. coracana]
MKAVVNNIGLDRVKNNNVSCTGIIALVRRDAATILSSGTTDPLARGRQDGNGMTSAEYDPLALGLNTRNKGDTLKNKELFKSDWVLPMDGKVAGKLVKYRDKPEEWNVDFAAAMAKLSSLSVQGKILEVRRNCRVTNKQYY